MKRRLLLGACLAWLCLGAAGARADTYFWIGDTKAPGKPNGGNLTTNLWEDLDTGHFAVTPGAGDIAAVGANPFTNGDSSGSNYLGLPAGASDLSLSLGALWVTGRQSKLFVGVSSSSVPVNGVLRLNGATLNGLDNVAVEYDGDVDSALSPGTATGLVFQKNVGPSTKASSFTVLLGTPSDPGDKTFVVRATAPATVNASPSIEFDVPIAETVAGSAVNFRGGGTGTASGAFIKLTGTGGTSTFTGGIVLGATGAASLDAADGVVLQIFDPAVLASAASPGTSVGDIVVNAGSTLWLNGKSANAFGIASETLTLNGGGTPGATARYAGTGALVSDAATASSWVGAVELASDSTVDVSGAGTFSLTGAVGGAGALVKAGGGTLLLSAANGYAGGTQVAAGTVEAGSADALGSGAVQVGAGARLKVDAGVRLAQAEVGLSGTANYLKAYDAGESLANFQAVRSDAGTVAGIAAGRAGAAETATATFGANGHGGAVAGDVLTLAGLGADAFALTLRLDPSQLAGGGLLEKWDTADAAWTLAGDAARTFFSGSFVAFAAAEGVTDANLESFLGDYGYDVATGQAWAVVDQDGDFAVAPQAVPEPGAWGLLAAGGGLLLLRNLRRKFTASTEA